MDYNDVYNTISRKIEKYVYVSEGKKHEIRLFISTNNDICFAPKRRRNGGYMLSVSEMEKWDSLTKVNKGNKTDLVKRMRKRAESGVAMLNESGLWTDIKKELLEFLDLSNDDIRRDFIDGDIYETYRSKKYDWLSCYQVFSSLKAKKCWKNPSFDKYDYSYKEHVINSVKCAIANKEDIRFAWRNVYDNTLEIIGANDIYRGYYSEEYRNCGNGHYYLLFDATHAIYYEDD